ncbi:hypothetical protein [Deinococcus aerolatus]|uniref:hypothetical protein n=1 Tax=Deinococcus aerolatus TaxID=522487 RepID=UPI00166631DF|nr:hypothetical protein [Deinococcus aerolatus]
MTAPGPMRPTLIDCRQRPAPAGPQPDAAGRLKPPRCRVVGPPQTPCDPPEETLPLRVRLP